MAEWPEVAVAVAQGLLARGGEERARARGLAERHSAERHLDAVEGVYRAALGDRS